MFLNEKENEIFEIRKSINDPTDLLDYMANNIQYGWLGTDNKIRKYTDKDFDGPDSEKEFWNKYKLQSPDELIKNKWGVCWDQVELERYFFSTFTKDILQFKTYFMKADNNQTHTFLVFENNSGVFYHFENSWGSYRGIHGPFNSEQRLVNEIISTFKKQFNVKAFRYKEYRKPKYGISGEKFHEFVGFPTTENPYL
jgi:hypothetical protein